MKRFLCIFILSIFLSPLFAENYSEMSTEELIAIMGYVKPPEKKMFLRELNSRVSTMNAKEKRRYKKNLKRIKKRR